MRDDSIFGGYQKGGARIVCERDRGELFSQHWAVDGEKNGRWVKRVVVVVYFVAASKARKQGVEVVDR